MIIKKHFDLEKFASLQGNIREFPFLKYKEFVGEFCVRIYQKSFYKNVRNFFWIFVSQNIRKVFF